MTTIDAFLICYGAFVLGVSFSMEAFCEFS